jgi:hypothetical protein
MSPGLPSRRSVPRSRTRPASAEAGPTSHSRALPRRLLSVAQRCPGYCSGRRSVQLSGQRRCCVREAGRSPEQCPPRYCSYGNRPRPAVTVPGTAHCLSAPAPAGVNRRTSVASCLPAHATMICASGSTAACALCACTNAFVVPSLHCLTTAFRAPGADLDMVRRATLATRSSPPVSTSWRASSGGGGVQFHVRCFYLWDALRRVTQTRRMSRAPERLLSEYLVSRPDADLCDACISEHTVLRVEAVAEQIGILANVTSVTELSRPRVSEAAQARSRKTEDTREESPMKRSRHPPCDNCGRVREIQSLREA